MGALYEQDLHPRSSNFEPSALAIGISYTFREIVRHNDTWNIWWKCASSSYKQVYQRTSTLNEIYCLSVTHTPSTLVIYLQNFISDLRKIIHKVCDGKIRVEKSTLSMLKRLRHNRWEGHCFDLQDCIGLVMLTISLVSMKAAPSSAIRNT